MSAMLITKLSQVTKNNRNGVIQDGETHGIRKKFLENEVVVFVCEFCAENSMVLKIR